MNKIVIAVAVLLCLDVACQPVRKPVELPASKLPKEVLKPKDVVPASNVVVENEIVGCFCVLGSDGCKCKVEPVKAVPVKAATQFSTVRKGVPVLRRIRNFVRK